MNGPERQGQQAGGAPAPDRYGHGRSYRWYALGVLMLIYLCHALDRSMPSILMEPVRAEFDLSDGQLGLYSGLGYGFAFAVFVLPMGHLTDRVHRRNFLAALVLCWSLFTALGGFARTYIQLALTRVGVGAAEAGASPITMAMLGDMFPAGQRASAIGMFYMSANLGTVIASAAGGYVAQEHGWRAALLIAGLPGILCALLLFFTVDEPRRGAMDADAGGDGPARFVEVLLFLARRPALICLICGCALLGLISISVGIWATSFFIRIHGLSLVEVGLLIGLAGGLGGVVAPPVYGWLGDRLVARDPAWPLRLVWISALVAMAAGMTMLFTPIAGIAIACYALGEFLRSGYPPPAYATLLANTPARMRGTVTSVLQFVTMLIGWGLGPLAVGLLSDFYGGGVMIRYALATALLVFIPVALLLIAASRLLPRPVTASA